MNPVETYIFELEECQQKIMVFFHELLANQYGLIPHLKWNIPTYFGKTWVIYLNPDKKRNGIHICFMRGNELSDKQTIVKFEGRKMVKSYFVDSIEKMPFKLLDDCIKEAITIDQTIPYKASNSKK